MNNINIHNVNAWGYTSHQLTPESHALHVTTIYIRNEDGVVFELDLFSNKPLKAQKLNPTKSYSELKGSESP